MTRKEYFKEPSLAGIVNDKEPVSVAKPYHLAEKVMGLEDGQYLAVQQLLIPPQYRTPRKFLKHGQFVQVSTPRSIDEAVDGHMLPWVLRQLAFDSIGSIYHPGYNFRPFAGYSKDQRERRVRLIELCEALRILSYGVQTGSEIEILRQYSEAQRVSKDGAVVFVSVPSRSEKQPRYRFNMHSVVLDSNDSNSYAVANGFWTDIHLPSKTWSFRYNFYDDKEDSNVVNIFAPEIAAYFKLMMSELNKQYKPNKSVADMNPFGIPTNLTVEFYKRLLSRVVIHDASLKGRLKLRRLNKAEQEVMLWALVKEMGYDATFFRRRLKRDGEVRNLDWRLTSRT